MTAAIPRAYVSYRQTDRQTDTERERASASASHGCRRGCEGWGLPAAFSLHRLLIFRYFPYFTPGVFGKTGTDTGPYDTAKRQKYHTTSKLFSGVLFLAVFFALSLFAFPFGFCDALLLELRPLLMHHEYKSCITRGHLAYRLSAASCMIALLPPLLLSSTS
ncbi:uncharacterized protein ARB_06693 [Trichophyton benhamiae CBS 112371]|uniref:Uncharacterized protein n=1 Tax=Arthroderma benhamiae (strain ATCC MYA-4681 / CBS 112371) TaxID=663331 RepID=D4ARF1_ARTBC|nr:uncharacterized protein ARB_06693 [Trichophyton benhamiae CBS 112371]EFE34294.1 hypothetical protein ARB_06693 [Trichophyton benhamiae CBS 112371]